MSERESHHVLVENDSATEDPAILAEQFQHIFPVTQEKMHTVTPESHKKFYLNWLKKEPPFLRFFLNLDHTATAIGMFSSVRGHLASGARILKLGGVWLDLINFLRIPILYLASFILDEPIPFKLTTVAKWSYAFFVLLLGMMIIALPMIAPLLAFIGAISVSFTSGLFFKHFIEKKKAYEVAFKNLPKEVVYCLEAHQRLKHTADVLKDLFHLEDDVSKRKAYLSELQSIREKQVHLQQTLQHLANQEVVLKEKLRRRTPWVVRDRVVAVSLSFFSVFATLITLFTPPVGFGILSVIGLSGLFYAVSRLIVPPIYHKILNFFKAKTMEEVTENRPSPPSLVNELIVKYDKKFPIDNVSEFFSLKMPNPLIKKETPAFELIEKSFKTSCDTGHKNIFQTAEFQKISDEDEGEAEGEHPHL